MKLSKHYKSSEYIFLFSILVLAIFLGTYFSFYAFLWRDIESEVTGFTKKYQMEGITGMLGNRCCYNQTSSGVVCQCNAYCNGPPCM